MNYIFDFDGTLVDSIGAFINLFNSGVRGKDNPLTVKEIESYRGMSSRRAIRKMGIRWWHLPKLLSDSLPDYIAQLSTLKPIPGLSDVIKTLHKRGDKLFVVTSNFEQNVETFLKNNHLETYFSGIMGGSGLFKKSKHIRKLVKKYHLKRRETIYVGDETRDISAARQARVRTASVTWGFNNKKILRRRHPQYLIENPSELLRIK